MRQIYKNINASPPGGPWGAPGGERTNIYISIHKIYVILYIYVYII